MAIFSSSEIRRRWTAVFDGLPGADAIVAPSSHNSYYLSGLPMLRWGRYAITILTGHGDASLVVPEFERVSSINNSPIEDIRTYIDEDGPSLPTATRLVVDCLRERGARTVAIEAGDMPASMEAQLRRELPGVTFIDATTAIDSARMVSSEEELRYIREASRVASVGIHAALEEIQPGIPERQIASLVRTVMEEAVDAAVQGVGTCYMQQGTRSSQCHALATAEPIATGGFVEVLIEFEAWHYQAAVERCVLIGQAPSKVERAYRAMAEAHQACIEAVRPGATFSAVDAAAREIFVAAGYEQITNGSGLIRNIIHHSGGRIPAGDLRPYNDRELQPGMVLTIEPWALIPDVGGAHHCDTVLVTGTGVEILTPAAAGIVRVDAAGPDGDADPRRGVASPAGGVR